MRSLKIAINYELCFVNDEKYRKHENIVKNLMS